ncbi:hypothetical protein K9N68_17010 [Kovacikia minuta CCNUW1]|uniref:hypothetical protein n=1 Tax=Kovacikia minuta TaxID=2931930 RepID=UPI001CCA5F81|nr:hypothetical protein [Kovacikia minuta]UBF29379.1 hypothetical protein K9N68_17010 [Kovacikia minuta CCNUW1]
MTTNYFQSAIASFVQDVKRTNLSAIIRRSDYGRGTISLIVAMPIDVGFRELNLVLGEGRSYWECWVRALTQPTRKGRSYSLLN